MSLFYIAQIVSVVTIIATIIALFQKEKCKSMIWFTLCNFSMMTTYALLNRWLSLILVGIASIRTFVYYVWAYKNLKPNIFVMASFEIVFVITAIVLWKDYLDLLMLINLCMLSYTTWQDNMKILRIGYLISAILLIAYNAFVGAYVGIVSEVILLITSIISIVKYDVKNKISDIVIFFYSTIAPFYRITIDENEQRAAIVSQAIDDEFNNFVYVKNPLEYKKQISFVKKTMKENNRKPAMYFQSKDNNNIQFIMETSREYKLLFRDVWMKLRDGANTVIKKCLLDNLTVKEVDEKYKKDIIYIFKEGFIHQSGDAIYKFDTDYITNYENYLTNENLKKFSSIPYLAFYNDKPIALLFLFKNGTNALLCQITTLKKYRRLGVATMLINKVIDCERRKGIDSFYLVTEKYTYIESFYLKNNFVEVSQGVCIDISQKISKKF